MAALAGLTVGCEEEHEHHHGYYGGAYDGTYQGYGYESAPGVYQGYPNYNVYPYHR